MARFVLALACGCLRLECGYHGYFSENFGSGTYFSILPMNARSLALALVFLLHQAGLALALAPSGGSGSEPHGCAMACCQSVAHAGGSSCGCVTDGSGEAPAVPLPNQRSIDERELQAPALWTLVPWFLKAPDYRDSAVLGWRAGMPQSLRTPKIALRVLHCVFLT